MDNLHIELKQKIADQQKLIDNNSTKILKLEIQLKEDKENLSQTIAEILYKELKAASL